MNNQLRYGSRTLVMGVLNVTPDSFSDGGAYGSAQAAVTRGLEMLATGADIIDVGGESTRPGAPEVGVDEELARVVPAIRGIRQAKPEAVISIDTTKAVVAREAILAGARMVNDISGLGFDPEMADVVASHDADLVLMHIQGTPRTMQLEPTYDDVVADISEFFEQRIARAVEAGVPEPRIILDPGIGFGKTLEHNLEILRRLGEFRQLGHPLLVGTSRKSFIGTLTGRPVEERAFGTAATVALAVAQGADIVRVHDVSEMVDVVRVCDAVVRA